MRTGQRKKTNKDMTSKTILITGTDSGLGKALTEVFSQHSWKVIAVSHKDLEITNQQSINSFVEKLHAKSIDVLINCAGIYDSPPGDEGVIASIAEITKVFQVNVIGARALTDALLPNLKKGKEKLVVTISSGMGTFSELEGDEYHAKRWPYSASKTAVNYAMIAFTKEHPEIKSVLINPGWMKTKIGGEEAPL